MPSKERSKKSIQDLIKYLKQREKKFGKKSGYSTDLNLDMLSFLHLIGQRKFNGVTLDDKGNMISDEVNPSFFHQYMSGDDEPSEEGVLRLPTRSSHEEEPDESSAPTGRILKFPTNRKRIKETNMREEFYDEHDITGDDLSFGDIELEEIEHDGKTYFGVFSATLTCIGNKISNFNYKLEKLYDKEDDKEVSENSPIFKEIEKSSRNDVLTCAAEEIRDMDMQHRDGMLDESSNDGKECPKCDGNGRVECPKCNGTGRVSNDSYNDYVGDARARRFFKESNGGLMRNYCLKTDLTFYWGWGNRHKAHFAAGTPCMKASNQPKNKFWIDGEPTSFTGNDLDFSSWMETYGFLVHRDEVEPCTESNTNYNNLNEASFHKGEFSNQIEVDDFEYQGRIFNCYVEYEIIYGAVWWEGDPSVYGGMHRRGRSIEDMEHKLLELYEVIGDDVIEIQQTDPIFKEVEEAVGQEIWNHYI